MNQKNLMPIREFSRLTGIKRENLRFYDQIGLLSPDVRGDNGYRYYSRHQLNSAYLIADLRELGMGLTEIKQYSLERTPEKMLALFSQQDKRIQSEISRLREIRNILKLHADMAADAIKQGESAWLLTEKEPEPIFLCPPIPADMDIDEGAGYAYYYAKEQGIHMGYPFGAVISLENFSAGDSSTVTRYFFKTKKGSNTIKPGGLYAVAYGRCNVWKSDHIYQKLLSFIMKQGLVPCGDAYEECPLDEMAVQDSNQYGIRVEVPVMKR